MELNKCSVYFEQSSKQGFRGSISRSDVRKAKSGYECYVSLSVTASQQAEVPLALNGICLDLLY